MAWGILDTSVVAPALVGQCALATLAACAGDTAFPGAAWEERSPASQSIDQAKLRAAVACLQDESWRHGVPELVIVRNDYLIWRGDNIDHVHGVWSLTKSFTSTVLGMLTDAGKVSLYWNFSNKWLSADGRHFSMAFAGRKENDSWNTIRGESVLR